MHVTMKRLSLQIGVLFIGFYIVLGRNDITTNQCIRQCSSYHRDGQIDLNNTLPVDYEK